MKKNNKKTPSYNRKNMKHLHYTAERMKVAASYRQSAMILHRDPLMRQLSALKEDCQEKGIPESVIEGINKAMDLFMVNSVNVFSQCKDKGVWEYLYFVPPFLQRGTTYVTSSLLP